MRRYIIALLVMALLIGSLFRAANETGVRLMNMFATIGIFLFGVVGTLALSRWQARTGLKELEGALKSLEPEWFITDWAYKGGGRPDFLAVGPNGLVAVICDETPQSTWARWAAGRVTKARVRSYKSAEWLHAQLTETGMDVSVEPVVVLTRRRAESEYSRDRVMVLNPDQLAEYVRSLGTRTPLDEAGRVRITRLLRSD